MAQRVEQQLNVGTCQPKQTFQNRISVLLFWRLWTRAVNPILRDDCWNPNRLCLFAVLCLVLPVSLSVARLLPCLSKQKSLFLLLLYDRSVKATLSDSNLLFWRGFFCFFLNQWENRRMNSHFLLLFTTNTGCTLRQAEKKSLFLLSNTFLILVGKQIKPWIWTLIFFYQTMSRSLIPHLENLA